MDIYKGYEFLTTTDNKEVVKLYTKAIVRSKLFWRKFKNLQLHACFCCNRPLTREEGLGVSLEEFKETNMAKRLLLAHVCYVISQKLSFINIEEIIDFVKNYQDIIYSISLKHFKGVVIFCSSCFKKYVDEIMLTQTKKEVK